ncbi:MAG TPA: hypothetical protein PLL53_03730, partial [Saprospiraceae bacterium]|nr:hypothetical protein [Saprospiraceae bacterium]
MKKKVYFRSFFRSAGLLLMPLIFLFDGLHAENAWLPPTPDCGTAYWNMSNNGVVSTQSIPNLTVSGILHGNNNTNPT